MFSFNTGAEKTTSKMKREKKRWRGRGGSRRRKRSEKGKEEKMKFNTEFFQPSNFFLLFPF